MCVHMDDSRWSRNNANAKGDSLGAIQHPDWASCGQAGDCAIRTQKRRAVDDFDVRVQGVAAGVFLPWWGRRQFQNFHENFIGSRQPGGVQRELLPIVDEERRLPGRGRAIGVKNEWHLDVLSAEAIQTAALIGSGFGVHFDQ